MKIYTAQSNFFLACICLLGLLLASCTKPAVNPGTPTPQAAVAFIQACPDEGPLSFLINNKNVLQGAISYGQNTGYLAITPGSNVFTFNSNASAAKILSDTTSFAENTIHTMFLTNTVSNPKLFLLTDTLVAPGVGNALVRFVNVSPDAPAADLVVQGGATLVTNRSFEGFSTFLPVAGNVFYTFQVNKTGTSTALATATGVKITAGNVYTVWFHGLAAGTTTAGDELKIDVMVNTSF